MNPSAFKQRRVSRRRSHAALASAVVSLALLGTACGSSDDSNSAAGDAGEVKAAENAVAKAATLPTTIPITEPLDGTPAQGETVVYLTVGDPSAQVLEDTLKEALDAVDWNLEVLSVDYTNPATTVEAMKQALTMDPAAVVVTTQPEVVWQSVIPDYEEAGVAIIASYVGPLELKGPVIANIAGPSYEQKMGEDIANWFIADSQGNGKALLYNVSELPTLKYFGESLINQVEEGCSECSIETLTGSIAQATGGQAVAAMVSALQRDPSIKYLLSDYGAWLGGLRPALEAAGLGDVKVASSSGLPSNLVAVQQGDEHATTQQNTWYVAWATVDAALRFAAGQEIPAESSDVPYQLAITGGDFAVPEVPTPADYQEHFKKLWHVG